LSRYLGCKGDEDEDEDVAAERNLVEQGFDALKYKDAIVMCELRKEYTGWGAACAGKGSGGGRKIALHNQSLAVKRGECFGYLGVNGAGKTTDCTAGALARTPPQMKLASLCF
jgi:ABC-type glutathione transport system ATPase component